MPVPPRRSAPAHGTAAYETGNLSAVARALSCTQSAVSQHIRRLERETGLPLVERHPRGVVPTPAGRILYEAAIGGLGALDAALRRLRELRDGHGGTVSVTTGGVTVRHFMADAIAAFRRRHPDVTLEFRSAQSTRRCVELLHSGRVDLAWITLGQPLPQVEPRPVIDLLWASATPSCPRSPASSPRPAARSVRSRSRH